MWAWPGIRRPSSWTANLTALTWAISWWARLIQDQMWSTVKYHEADVDVSSQNFAGAHTPHRSASRCQLSLSQKVIGDDDGLRNNKYAGTIVNSLVSWHCFQSKTPIGQKSPRSSLKLTAMKRMRDAGWAAVVTQDKKKKRVNDKIFA